MLNILCHPTESRKVNLFINYRKTAYLHAINLNKNYNELQTVAMNAIQIQITLNYDKVQRSYRTMTNVMCLGIFVLHNFRLSSGVFEA